MNRFVVDLMLLRLGRWLRLLGQDVENPDSSSDDGLLHQALMEGRTVITRDKRLAEACRHRSIKCILIDSSHVSEQILEMSKRGIRLEIKPKRCTLCNSLLQDVSSQERKWICTGCKRFYWEGSHWDRMKDMLEKVRSIQRSKN